MVSIYPTWHVFLSHSKRMGNVCLFSLESYFFVIFFVLSLLLLFPSEFWKLIMYIQMDGVLTYLILFMQTTSTSSYMVVL